MQLLLHKFLPFALTGVMLEIMTLAALQTPASSDGIKSFSSYVCDVDLEIVYINASLCLDLMRDSLRSKVQAPPQVGTSS